MSVDNKSMRINDKLEAASRRAAQLSALAMVLHNAIAFVDGAAELSDTAWLLYELLQDQHDAIEQLHQTYIKYA